jgi:hypothetical protein
LRPHRGVEARLIDAETLTPEDVLGQVEGKAVGVVELERDVAVEAIAAARPELRDLVGEESQTLLERLAEALFFAGHGAPHPVARSRELRVCAAEEIHRAIGDLAEEGLGQAEHAALARGAPEQAAEHVAATFVRGRDSVGDHDRDRARDRRSRGTRRRGRSSRRGTAWQRAPRRR